MEQVSVNIGIFDRIIKESGTKPDGELVMVGLTSEDLRSIMSDLLKSAAQVPGLTITPNIRAEIREGKGRVSGNVAVDHSLIGHSESNIDLIFGNNPQISNAIVAERKSVTTNLSLRAKLALASKDIDLEKEIRSKLSDPQKALNELMTQAFHDKGRKLQSFGAIFSPNKDVLILGLKSRKN